jgi:hypothetical protein
MNEAMLGAMIAHVENVAALVDDAVSVSRPEIAKVVPGAF